MKKLLLVLPLLLGSFQRENKNHTTYVNPPQQYSQYSIYESGNVNLDENWSYKERNDWWFFPDSNIAIRKNPLLEKIVTERTIYYAWEFEFRAMKGTTMFDPYRVRLSGISGDDAYMDPFAYNMRGDCVIGCIARNERRCECLQSTLRRIPINAEVEVDPERKGWGGIEVGSSPYATVKRKISFPIFEQRVRNDFWSGENRAFIDVWTPTLKGVIHLVIGSEKVQFTNIDSNPYIEVIPHR
jgi:hypothetical protein